MRGVLAGGGDATYVLAYRPRRPEAALHHAWINQTAPKTIDTQLGADVLERIRGFEATWLGGRVRFGARPLPN